MNMRYFDLIRHPTIYIVIWILLASLFFYFWDYLGIARWILLPVLMFSVPSINYFKSKTKHKSQSNNDL